MICFNRPGIKELEIELFTFIFLNMDISLDIYIINLKCFTCIIKVPLKGIHVSNPCSKNVGEKRIFVFPYYYFTELSMDFYIIYIDIILLSDWS